MSRERADLGFAAALDEFSPAEWEPTPESSVRQKPEKRASLMVAEASGFKSREALKPGRTGDQSALRRRRTGRNTQFNLKTRPDIIAAFCKIADGQGWGLGETLEHAVALLEREYGGRG